MLLYFACIALTAFSALSSSSVLASSTPLSRCEIVLGSSTGFAPIENIKEESLRPQSYEYFWLEQNGQAVSFLRGLNRARKKIVPCEEPFGYIENLSNLTIHKSLDSCATQTGGFVFHIERDVHFLHNDPTAHQYRYAAMINVAIAADELSEAAFLKAVDSLPTFKKQKGSARQASHTYIGYTDSTQNILINRSWFENDGTWNLGIIYEDRIESLETVLQEKVPALIALLKFFLPERMIPEAVVKASIEVATQSNKVPHLIETSIP